jgi:hypothetical protein
MEVGTTSWLHLFLDWDLKLLTSSSTIRGKNDKMATTCAYNTDNAPSPLRSSGITSSFARETSLFKHHLHLLVTTASDTSSLQQSNSTYQLHRILLASRSLPTMRPSLNILALAVYATSALAWVADVFFCIDPEAHCCTILSTSGIGVNCIVAYHPTV